MSTFFLVWGLVCVFFGVLAFVWGLMGRLDRHSSSSDDDYLVVLGFLLGAWGTFLALVAVL